MEPEVLNGATQEVFQGFKMDSVNLMLGRGASIAQVARDLGVNQKQSGETDTKSPGSKFYPPHSVAESPLVNQIPHANPRSSQRWPSRIMIGTIDHSRARWLQSFIDIWPAQHDSNVRPTP